MLARRFAASRPVVRGLVPLGVLVGLILGLRVADSAVIQSLAAAESPAPVEAAVGSCGAAFGPDFPAAPALASSAFASVRAQVVTDVPDSAGDPEPVLPAAAQKQQFLVAKKLDGKLYVALNDGMTLVKGMTGWDEANHRAQTISREGLLEYQADTRRYLRNERELETKLPTRLVGGTFYLSLDDFGEVYGLPVTYDEEGRATIAVAGQQVPVREEAELYEIYINRTQRTLTLKYLGRTVKTYPVCVGAGVNTPLGRFHIANKVVWPSWRSLSTGRLVPPGPSNPLGPRWMGTSAVGDEGHVIGIHGNNRPSSIGRAVSHGCIRMYNKDALELFDTIMVGTPVIMHR